MSDPQMQANVRLYPAYAGLYNAFFWIPVFFLYFGQKFTLAEVLQLESVYYFAVVLLEVPSGYFSDRVGRRTTLLISGVALSCAYFAFAMGDSFGIFALAQVLLAVGIALNSGTDTSFHFDSLAAAGLADEYDEREARVARTSLAATGIAALTGGAIGVWNLSFVYFASAVASVMSIGIVLAFREPPHSESAAGFANQTRECVRQLQDPVLRWLFGVAVLLVLVNHLPYEFYQPYLDLLGSDLGFGESASLTAGAHTAIATFIGAWFARRSARFARWAGTARALLFAAGLQIAIVVTMGAVLHPLIVLVILLRGIPGALSRAPLNAAIVPRIPQRLRATYLSIQSLAGRLSFSGLLLGLSLYAGDASTATWPVLSPLLLVAAGLAAVLWLFLAATHRAGAGQSS